MPNATVGADAPASPKSAIDAEISRLQCDKIVADVLLEEATARKKKAAAAAAEVEAEEPKRRASREFGEAHYAWLTAKARIEDPNVEDDDLARLGLEAEAAAERRLMTTPAAWPDQVWQKLGAFETILTHELVAGERRDSIILLSLASLKQDIHNLGLCNGDAS
jgi:hypothetical protein